MINSESRSKLRQLKSRSWHGRSPAFHDCRETERDHDLPDTENPVVDVHSRSPDVPACRVRLSESSTSRGRPRRGFRGTLSEPPPAKTAALRSSSTREVGAALEGAGG